MEKFQFGVAKMDCFISYANSDVKIARKLRKLLIEKGLAVFLAPDTIEAGGRWSPAIQRAARRSDVVVLLDSADSRKSPWVQQEAGMALASGSLLIPVSLDGKFNELPGWLGGFQAIEAIPGKALDKSLALVADRACDRLGATWSTLPAELQMPKTVGSFVLRTILLDQFTGPEERRGAWSRQYDRYLRIYYGDDDARHGVSQGASLTFTGMIVERLALLAAGSGPVPELAAGALRRAEAFILLSQHREQGGFGRLTADRRVRGERALTLDLRHTCWAIRALVSIDQQRLAQHITNGLRWLAWRARHRDDKDDKWCWTTAPLLALMNDPRLAATDEWRQECSALTETLQADLEASWDAASQSWVKGEEQPKWRWVSADNALYVLYCLKDIKNLSEQLNNQRQEAIKGLLARSASYNGDGIGRGIPLFSEQPEIGPTAQLLEIMNCMGYTDKIAELSLFVASRLAAGQPMPETFSWNLSSILAAPDLFRQPLYPDS